MSVHLVLLEGHKLVEPMATRGLVLTEISSIPMHATHYDLLRLCISVRRESANHWKSTNKKLEHVTRPPNAQSDCGCNCGLNLGFCGNEAFGSIPLCSRLLLSDRFALFILDLISPLRQRQQHLLLQRLDLVALFLQWDYSILLYLAQTRPCLWIRDLSGLTVTDCAGGRRLCAVGFVRLKQ